MEGFKDVLAMVGTQSIYAGFALFSKVAFEDGLNPQIYIVYRQVLATFLIAPLALISKKKSGSSLSLDLKTFAMIFAAALFGITIYQSTFYEGIFFANAAVASALVNLTSAVTFVLAVLVRYTPITKFRVVKMDFKVEYYKYEKVDTESSIRHGSESSTSSSTWLLGCLLVFVSCCCWAVWLILQVPITKNCPDHLYSTFLTCFFGTVQSTVLAMFMERHLDDWKLDKTMEYVACIYSGVASAVAFFGQAWCISRRGPVFSAAFNPLQTVIVTIIGFIFLGETIYLGSLLGAVAIFIGLYMVLWGKATDHIKGSTINLDEPVVPIDVESVIDPIELPITGASNQLDIKTSHDSIHDRSRNGARI